VSEKFPHILKNLSELLDNPTPNPSPRAGRGRGGVIFENLN